MLQVRIPAFINLTMLSRIEACVKQKKDHRHQKKDFMKSWLLVNGS